jgi:glycine cleavage system T protein
LLLFLEPASTYIEAMSTRPPIYAWHESAGAKFTEFAGWEMPLSYGSGAVAEHHLVRRSAGLFDVSHMAQFEISGDGATAFLNQLVSANVAQVPANSSTYALLCAEDGGVVDDLYCYRLPDRWFIVANAANRAEDADWIRSKLAAWDGEAEFADVSDANAMFALQGPRAMGVADAVTGGGASDIPRFGIAELAGVRVGRTGYTGEDGVEFFVGPAEALGFWTGVIEAAEKDGVEIGPIGLAARDSLRFEPGFALYGHELSRDITPLEARLAWACDLEKDFIGRDALVKQKQDGLSKRLATVQMVDRGVPREGYQVLHEGKVVGTVATGMLAPTLEGFFANVFVPPALAKTGADVDIEIRGAARAARVVKRPLYTPAYR